MSSDVDAWSAEKPLFLLADAEDKETLSEGLCFVRKQVEFFEATEEDLKARFRKGGAKKQLAKGGVGIRCIHCRNCPAAERKNGAVSYPRNVALVYQAVRNWQRYHMMICPYISEELKSEYKSFKRSHSSNSIIQYWIDSCHRKGLVDLEGDGALGIRMGNHQASLAATSIPAKSTVSRTRRKPRSKNAISNDISYPLEEVNSIEISSVAEKSNHPTIQENGEESNLFASGGFESGSDVMVLNLIDGKTNFGAAASVHIDNNGTNSKGLDQEQDLSLWKSTEGENSIDPYFPAKDEGDTADGNALTPDPAHGFRAIHKQIAVARNLVQATSEIRIFPGLGCETKADLRALGEVLYQHFTGFRPFQNDLLSSAGINPSGSLDIDEDGDSDQSWNRPRRKRERHIATSAVRTGGGKHIPLSELGFPVSLSNLVTSLCFADENACLIAYPKSYSTSDEVLEELDLMITDPDRYLFADKNSGPGGASLRLTSDKLYGREKHVADMRDALDRMMNCGGRMEVLLIAGYSGTGKSTLGRHLRYTLETEWVGSFLSGKFDELQQVKPMTAIFSALNDYCDELLRGGDDKLKQVRARLKVVLESDARVLTTLIPSLQKIVDAPTDELPPEHQEGNASFSQLLLFVRQFIRTISSSAHPLVLMLDDMQWADESSLEMVESIIADVNITYFLFIGCYRNNEILQDHPLNGLVHNMKDSGATVTEIQVDNIDGAAINELVSDALHISPPQSRSLADLIFQKTSGNALFVVKFIQTLYDEGLLRYSLSSRRWTWDVDAIQSKTVADSVAELLTDKMLQYPPEVLRSLKLASCLGHQFEESMIQLVGEHNRCRNISFLLDISVSAGLMYKVGNLYTWSHAAIQGAAYSLIEVDAQAALHAQIGRTLLQKASSAELDNFLFIIVDQLGRGSSLIVDRGERTRVARLYLRAGEEAARALAFLATSVFFLRGLNLLDASHWRSDYELALSLHSRYAKACANRGDFDEVMRTADIVVANAESCHDALPAYMARMQVTTAKGMLLEGTNLGLEMLAMLGHAIPHEVEEKDVTAAMEETRALLVSFSPSVSDVHELPQMKDTNTLAAVTLMEKVQLSTFHLHQPHFAVLACRVVQLSLRYGVCKDSCFAFCVFGWQMCNYGHFELGHKCGKAALQLINRFNARDRIQQVYCIYTCIFPFDPVQATLAQLETAYRVGKATGDVEWASPIVSRMVTMGLLFGQNLDKVKKLAKSCLEGMTSTNQPSDLSTAVSLQGVMNLTNAACRNPVILTGSILVESEALQQAKDIKSKALESQILRVRLFLAYLFREYEIAADIVLTLTAAMERWPYKKLSVLLSDTLLTGLVGAQMARLGEREKWIPIALGAKKKYEKWCDLSPWNYQHGLLLLEAEIAYSEANIEKATKAYDGAIRAAKKHKFVHHEALANERAGIFNMEIFQGSSSNLSKTYFEQARALYNSWGAVRKSSDELLILLK